PLENWPSIYVLRAQYVSITDRPLDIVDDSVRELYKNSKEKHNARITNSNTNNKITKLRIPSHKVFDPNSNFDQAAESEGMEVVNGIVYLNYNLTNAELLHQKYNILYPPDYKKITNFTDALALEERIEYYLFDKPGFDPKNLRFAHDPGALTTITISWFVLRRILSNPLYENEINIDNVMTTNELLSLMPSTDDDKKQTSTFTLLNYMKKDLEHVIAKIKAEVHSELNALYRELVNLGDKIRVTQEKGSKLESKANAARIVHKNADATPENISKMNNDISSLKQKKNVIREEWRPLISTSTSLLQQLNTYATSDQSDENEVFANQMKLQLNEQINDIQTHSNLKGVRFQIRQIEIIRDQKVNARFAARLDAEAKFQARTAQINSQVTVLNDMVDGNIETLEKLETNFKNTDPTNEAANVAIIASADGTSTL